jgi:kynurenine 3-monooxygenase
MTAATTEVVTIVGAGPVGTLMALLLARRGQRVRVIERRADPREQPPEHGRSINLALAGRGLRALEQAAVLDAVRPEMVRMPGRILHEAGVPPRFWPYGQSDDEVLWSISRAHLNRALIVAAAEHAGIELQFHRRCIDLDADTGTVAWQDDAGITHHQPAHTLIAADGAGSAIRHAMQSRHLCQATEDELAHDYKELHIPPLPHGGHALEAHGLHIWPRGGFMLIALPNTDGSFTATLFLAREGQESFAALRDAPAVRAFFARHFTDVLPLIPDLEQQFAAHPQSQLATLHCWPWHARRCLLIGDAAHAIVPFHGQGLNCGFEDCLVLDTLMSQQPDPALAFAQFEAQRRLDTDAIAIMALENYQEMRDQVLRPDFVRRRELALTLERLFPGRFIPRYGMVMFHPDISYSAALQRGNTQERLLDALIAEGLAPESPRAASLLDQAGL